jgi:hypothetical protein
LTFFNIDLSDLKLNIFSDFFLLQGYIIDEIDGRYSVIQSDDVEKGDTWVVSNMIMSTVSEFLEQRSSLEIGEEILELYTVNPPADTVVLDKPPTITIASEMNLFLHCLEKELAKTKDGNAAPHALPNI